MPDLEIDDDGDVCPGATDENGNFRGLSTFAKPEDLAQFVKGQVWRLPAGSSIPMELAVVKDAPLSHHTIYPTQTMSYAELKRLYLSLGWVPAGHTNDYK